MDALTVNGRTYRWPRTPVAVLCVDGLGPAYLDGPLARGLMPALAAMIARGARFVADAEVPTFTNPNNVSIVTGAPPSVHGISGNWFWDAGAGAEVMMNDPAQLRAESILAAFARAGARVAVVTAKDKLRRLLGHGWTGACLSAERAEPGAMALAGMPRPDVYSAAASEFVLAVGARLAETARPALLYLSTTDYVQHKHAPDTPEADAFAAMLDRHLARLDAAGATVVLTADHGMSAKSDSAGAPQALWLADVLDAWLGPDRARVVLPITDPYVVHHGALGGFATVYLPEDAAAADVARRLTELPGVELALERDAACARFELPPDRLGDVVVLAEEPWALGASRARHDLSALDAPLRSHGGLAERAVPLVVNRPVEGAPPGDRWRNRDAFHLALNAVTA